MMAWQASTLWRYAVRQLWRRPARTVLTLLGIVLGVATIVAVTLTTQTTRSAYHEMFATVTGRAAARSGYRRVRGLRPGRGPAP